MSVTIPIPLSWLRWRRPHIWGVGIFLVLLSSTHWFTLNISASVPLGLYRYVQGAGELRRGDLVRLPAVSSARAWFAHGFPLLKPVAGLPGETVCVRPEGLWVADHYYGPVYTEAQGDLLPVFWGCHVVGAVEVFVASHAPRSFDGRYFGMTPMAHLRRVVPVWVWE